MRVRAAGAVMVAAVAWRCASAPPDAVPPQQSPKAGAADTSGAASTFAFTSVALGDADDAGNLSATGWKLLGYDLDGKDTNPLSTDVCTLHTGASKSNQADGIGGSDNAFGSVIVPIVDSLVDPGPICIIGPCPDAGPPFALSHVETETIEEGLFTLQVSIEGLSDDSDQTASDLSADVFSSGAFGGSSSPAFDSSTDWPVQPESLVDPNDLASGALAHFHSAYVTDGTFVAGTDESVTVPLYAVINGFTFTLAIHHAILTFRHVDSDNGADGVLAGVLDTEELVTVFRREAGRASSAFCGDGSDGIADYVRQASDILSDRSNHAGTPCTAISFGIGFHAKRIANPTTIAPPTVVDDPCAPADGGLDASAE